MTKNEEGIIRQNVRLARDQREQLTIESELHGISVTEICYICRDVPVRNKQTMKYIQRLANYYAKNGKPRPESTGGRKTKKIDDEHIEEVAREQIARLVYATGKQYKDVAHDVGVGKQVITEIMSENGRPPSLNTAFRFARCFDVSLDFLCGISTQKQTERTVLPPIDKTLLNEAIRGRMSEIIKQSSLTGREIAGICGIDEHTLCNIQKAKHTPPTLSTVTKFAKGMGVSMEWLCGFKEV